MKNGILVGVLSFILLAFGIFGLSTLSAKNTEISADNFLRIHIRANSNSTLDQNVKYKVKDRIVEYLTPIVAEAGSKEKAMSLIQENIDEISNISSLALQQEGYNYKAQASLKREYFPVRAYNDVVLESGEYDSLIVNLGSGQGNNWWCVVYPPLCFVASDNNTNEVVYRSKILDIIKNFFGG